MGSAVLRRHNGSPGRRLQQDHGQLLPDHGSGLPTRLHLARSQYDLQQLQHSSGGTTDFGDAPDMYATTLASDGARHVITAGVYLGRQIDGESNGLPSTDATGDDEDGLDDEDGVVFTSVLTPGDSATIQVTASVDGYLNAWMDFDRDGTFNDADEQIFTDTRLSAGTNTLTFRIPATAAPGDTFARFRFNRRGLLSWKGLATDGEVEDYKVSLATDFEPQIELQSRRCEMVPASPGLRIDALRLPELERAVGHDLLSDRGRRLAVPGPSACDGLSVVGNLLELDAIPHAVRAPSAFQLSIWTNNPASTAKNSFAHPSTLVWQATCTNWVWSVAGQAKDPRKVNNTETCFEFTCLLSQDQWFYQDDPQGTATYWLSIAAVYDTKQTPANPWGWMTGPAASNNGAVILTAAASAGGSAVWPPSLASIWSTGSPIVDTKAAIQHMAFNVLTNEGQTASDLDLSPVYRFWSAGLATHFYTISETEKEKLITQFADVWQYEGVAFYAYAPGSQPTAPCPCIDSGRQRMATISIRSVNPKRPS